MHLPRWLKLAREWLRNRNKRKPQREDKIEFVDIFDLGIDPQISKDQQIRDWCIGTKILSQDAIEFLRGDYGACSEELLIERFEALIDEIERLEESL